MPTPTPNPYQPPVEAEVLAADGDDRGRAKRWVISALLILLLPAILNFFCWHFVYAPHRFPGGYVVPRWLLPLVLPFNLLGLVAMWVVLYFVGLRAVETICVAWHYFFKVRGPLGRWLAALHRALWPLPWTALLIAVAWTLWLYLFFFTTYRAMLAIEAVAVLIAGAGLLLLGGSVLRELYGASRGE